jgi:hypothetical protein
VLFIFAGKAHPADKPGQELIRRIHEISRWPEFEGKLLMVEGYDLGFARRLVSGCDVWLNNPIYPLEASGTSGMKAAMNGVLNLSVTDGWWDEGYDGGNGWAIKPAPEYFDDARRNREDSRDLYELLQDQVIPMYYRRNELGISSEWVRMAKRSITTLLPRFNSTRMVMEYVNKFYGPASRQWRRYSEGGFAAAQGVAAWKAKVRQAWSGVSLRRLDEPQKRILRRDPVPQGGGEPERARPGGCAGGSPHGPGLEAGPGPGPAGRAHDPGWLGRPGFPVHPGTHPGHVRQAALPCAGLSLSRTADPPVRNRVDGLAVRQVDSFQLSVGSCCLLPTAY